MPTLNTCLWFSPDIAPKAIDLYTRVIPNSRVVSMTEFDNEQEPSGKVRIWTLNIAGTPTRVMGASHSQEHTMAHSMFLLAKDQAELDAVWDGFLAAGGKEFACGWIADPFGVSWQIIPEAWGRLIEGPAEQAQRVAEALWSMVKIDVAVLENAARG